MPIKRCQEDNKPGYKWGDAGKCYIYNPNDENSIKESKKKAMSQGVAIGDFQSNPISEFKSKLAEPKISFDFDGTLTKSDIADAAKAAVKFGADVYVISARDSVDDYMLEIAKSVGIREDHVFAVGSNQAKVEKIKSLGISLHYDDNQDVIDQLDGIGQIVK